MRFFPILMLLFPPLVASAWGQQEQTVKVKVIEEDQSPIGDAHVMIAFVSQEVEKQRGTTNPLGEFQASGTPRFGVVVEVKKDGYYSTKSERLRRDQDHDLNFVLRKVKNPIPLHAKRVILNLPRNQEWLGFDLKSGDWLPPHGERIIADLEIKCDTEQVGNRDAKGQLQLRFNDGEGIHDATDRYLKYSNMKLPHRAPEAKYQVSFQRAETSFRNENHNPNAGFFLRTRVKREENGKLLSANYGKIVGGIRFDPRELSSYNKDRGAPNGYATVSFTYYFNPKPNDRNLEFDPSQNLLKDLKNRERVHAP